MGLRWVATLTIVSILTSCAPGPDRSPATTALPASSTTFSPATTTTETAGELVLTLGETEALATDYGTRIEVADEEGAVLGWLDRAQPRLLVPRSPDLLTMRYVSDDGRPGDVSWQQASTQSHLEVSQPWRGHRRCEVSLPDGSMSPVSLVWQSGADSTTYLRQLDGSDGKVSVVSPVWWRVGAGGEVVGETDPQFVSAVHDRNVAVWPAVAGFDAGTLHMVLSDPTRRAGLAERIADEARGSGADGVNLDIEGYRVDDARAFLTWVEELAGAVHEWGGVVSYDLVPHSDTWEVSPPELSFWSSAPLRTELSLATDCTVLMAYDQYNRYRPSGPVASPPWVEDVLVHALRHVDPARLVLGIPFYGRVWDPSDLENPQSVPIGVMDDLGEEGRVSHDEGFGLDRVDLPGGHYSWIEDIGGLRRRFELVDSYGLAGWAAWRFGFDSPEVWELVERATR